MWVFGYGSLIFRPAFRFEQRAPAWLSGYERRFWQGSTDHRGVPGAPGRVVTLVAEPGAQCWGMAYRIAQPDVAEVLTQLDHREKGGYERRAVRLAILGSAPVDGLVYFASIGNPEWLGPASIDAIAAQIAGAEGPSGRNRDYARSLADALRSAGVVDAHVEEVVGALNLRCPPVSDLPRAT